MAEELAELRQRLEDKEREIRAAAPALWYGPAKDEPGEEPVDRDQYLKALQEVRRDRQRYADPRVAELRRLIKDALPWVEAYASEYETTGIRLAEGCDQKEHDRVVSLMKEEASKC